MSDIAEGLGGAVEGALLGGAVEPEHGKSGATVGDGVCQNCGAQPLGKYCQNCGQKVHIHRTLAALGHDLLHGVLHLDGKFWSTLPLLVFKPGKLTRRYIDGERAKFVSPMAMFLFSVFAMFAVFQMVGLKVPTDLGNVSPAQLERQVEGQTQRAADELDKIENQLAEPGLSEEERARLEADRAELAGLLEGLGRVGELPILGGGSDAQNGPGSTVPEGEVGGSDQIVSLDDLENEFVEKWRDNPSLMLYKLQANGYKFSWLLIPLSIPFVWLTFAWRRRFHAYDHAIFVTYSLSFMSLLFIAVSLIFRFEPLVPVALTAILLVPPFHLYKQLRGTYEIGRFSAFWRLIVLSGFIWIVVILFVLALLQLGAL